ncbi:hypothetical protein [Rugosimonospora acidiphila]|uniref:hypothetical protein n=1 Tax=Rugosimonospora acidiphila TaxID=556531 RepID=UPI0031E6DA26
MKVDGEREHLPWTVVISGRALGEGAIRFDGPSLDYCVAHSLAELRRRMPAVDLLS